MEPKRIYEKLRELCKDCKLQNCAFCFENELERIITQTMLIVKQFRKVFVVSYKDPVNDDEKTIHGVYNTREKAQLKVNELMQIFKNNPTVKYIELTEQDVQ